MTGNFTASSCWRQNLRNIGVTAFAECPRFRFGTARDWVGTTAGLAVWASCGLDSVVKDLSCRGSTIISEITCSSICYRKWSW